MVHKIPSHQDVGGVAMGAIPPFAFVGNAVADKLAGIGASLHACTQEDQDTIAATDARIWSVQRRLLAIALASNPVDVSKRKHVRRRIDWDMVLEQTGHRVFNCALGKRCFYCDQKVSVNSYKAWLKTGECMGRSQPVVGHGSCGVDRPRPLSVPTTVTVGGKPLHKSHRLVSYRGCFWCWHCGCYCTHRPLALADECKPPTATGLRQIARLKKGKSPRADVQWPLPADGMPFPRIPAVLAGSPAESILLVAARRGGLNFGN